MKYKTDQEIAKSNRERAKRQNQAAREKWDCISCRLPKGTKKEIEKHGYTVNGFVNSVVLEKLELLNKK